MKILVACEHYGKIRDAFKARGHNAWSCDLLPSETPGNHFQDDIFHVLSNTMYWDLIIGHPPCKFLSNSGVKHLYINGKKENGKDINRWVNMELAVSFFNSLLAANCDKVSLENPIQHGYAKERIRQPYSQIIQPYQFGHLEKKATCLWLKGLPLLKETNNVYAEMMQLPYKERAKVHYMSPGPERANLRSKTYEGIAQAMANQWG